MSPTGWDRALAGTVERHDPVGAGLRVHSLHWPGAGRPVVLVHGMIVAGRSMVGPAGILAARGADVHVPDLAGFGLSDRPRRALDVDGLADALAGWLRVRRLQGCLLVGNSFGTQVAAALSARHPDLPGAVALIAPTIDPKWTRRVPGWVLGTAGGGGDGVPGEDGGDGAPGGEVRRGAARRLWAETLASPWIPQGRPSLRRLIWSEYTAAGPRRVVSTYRYALADRIEDRMARIGCPVVVARGTQDDLVTEGWAAHLAELAPRGRFTPVAGATHDAEFERPDLFAATVAEMLEDQSPTDTP